MVHNLWILTEFVFRHFRGTKDESVESLDLALQNEANLRGKFKLENQFAEGSRIDNFRTKNAKESEEQWTSQGTSDHIEPNGS